MKNNLSLQLSSGVSMMMTEQSSFASNDMGNKISEYVNRFLPAKSSSALGPVNPVSKFYGRETGLNRFLNLPMKELGARLSEIEMALECYDISGLRFSTHGLTELFLDMRMPAVCRLAGKMEEMANENQWQDVKDLLREIKKIIGRIVKQRMQTGD